MNEKRIAELRKIASNCFNNFISHLLMNYHSSERLNNEEIEFIKREMVVYMMNHKFPEEKKKDTGKEDNLNNSKKRFAPVKMIASLYPGMFTPSSLRWLIFNEKQNGFSVCVRRIGRKILIDLDEFELWIDRYGRKTV